MLPKGCSIVGGGAACGRFVNRPYGVNRRGGNLPPARRRRRNDRWYLQDIAQDAEQDEANGPQDHEGGTAQLF